MIVEDIGSRVLYRDALVLVIDKPAGLPVHPGPKGGETLSQHLDALRFGLPRRPEIAPRLARDPAGCLALGRPARARHASPASQRRCASPSTSSSEDIRRCPAQPAAKSGSPCRWR